MYRKNVASQFIGFQLNSATTGAGLAGLTVTVNRCIDGAGAYSSGGGTVTSLGSGGYVYAMSQADTNGNDITFQFSGSGAVTVEKTIVTTAADPTDTVRFGLTALPNAIAGANTGLPVVGTQVPNATAGASNGLLISGTNSGTTTFGAVTVTGATTLTGGLTGTASSTFWGSYLDLTDGIETGVTPRQATRAIAAASGGTLSGGGTTSQTIYALGNAGTARLTATVDSSGNRITITPSL